jgi:hypothetical protein
MTMGVVYQLTFFLALGLLAIVVAVFVFAVSLLGRALEAAAKSEREKLAERRKNNERAMAAIRRKIREAERKGQVSKGLIRQLQRELKKLGKGDKKDEKELGKIRRAPKLLTVKGLVVPVGVSLLVALIFNGVAWYFWYLSTLDVFWDIYLPFGFFIRIEPVFIWIVSLAAILYSIFWIYLSLKVVESVAITSEEAALRKTVEAFKIAQKELEKEKKPELTLEFGGDQPPFHIKSGSQKTIVTELGLVRGDVAKRPEVYFLAPPGFNFPKRKTWVQAEEKETVGGYLTTQFELEDFKRGVTQRKKIIIKAPSSSGKFTFYYRITAEGFDSSYEEFEVVVE